MTVIFSVAMLLLAALAVFLGVLKGKKYTWVYSAMRIVLAVVAVFLSVGLATLGARILGNFLNGLMQGVLPTSLETLFGEIPSMSLFVKVLVFAVISPILFGVLFSILYNVLNIFGKKLAVVLVKALPARVTGVATPTQPSEENSDAAESDETDQEIKKTKKVKRVKNEGLRVSGKNPIGMICGGVCALLLFCIGFAPAIGTDVTVYRVVGAFGSLSQPDKAVSVVTDVMGASVNNVGTKMFRFLGGDVLYDGLTTYRTDEGEKIRLYRETDSIGKLLDARSRYANP